MVNRALYWASILSFVQAALLAVVAIVLFARAGASEFSAWILILCGAILAAAGVRIQSLMRQSADSNAESLSQINLLQEQLAQQRSAVDSLADGLDVAIFICDPRASILYANKRATDFFRFSDPRGRSILAVTLSYDLEQLVLNAAKQREPQAAELSFAFPEERVGLATAWPPEGDAERVFVSVYEITDLRRLERVRQNFVSNVSHELRTPLTIIRAMAETLLDEEEPDPETLRKYLNKVVTEVDRLSMIANDLLILSAAESNPVRKHSCDIADIFRSVLNQLAAKAKERGLEVAFEGPETCVIEANSAQMTQVAMNLIDNAINYSTHGTVTVHLNKGEGFVEVSVSDTGIGIASEHLPHIFERFYRVDKARTRMTGGTGLGLSIVRHIAEAHGGSVSVESKLNVGSTFTIRLPAGE